MAYWGRKVKYQIKPGEPFTIGGGENTYLPPLNINKEEYSYSRNMTSRLYPSASVRPGCLKYATPISTPLALGQRNNEYIHAFSDGIWKRWDGANWSGVKTGLANVPGKFIEFNTEAARQTVLFSMQDSPHAWDGTSVVQLAGAPCTNLVTVDDYRVYALDGTNLKCSAMGSITDWTTADDADTIALTSAKGAGTALTAYNDTVIAWTEHSMHILYGNDPYDFYLNDPLDDGCISDKSVIEHNGKLYFLDYGAYKVYTGGRPQDISQPVKKYLDGINPSKKRLCAAGKQGKYIYLSIPYGSSTTNSLTLEYDAELGKWYPHSKGYVEFVNIGENLYGIDAIGQIYKLNTGTNDAGAAISWELVTGARNHGAVSQKKAISDFWIVADLPVNSTMTIYYSTTIDGDDFKALCTFTGTGTEQNTRVQVPTSVMQNIDWYRLKIAGKGSCVIHYLEESFRIKAR